MNKIKSILLSFCLFVFGVMSFSNVSLAQDAGIVSRLDATNCTIPVGQNECDSAVTWSTNGDSQWILYRSTAGMPNENINITTNNGNRSIKIKYGNTRFEFTSDRLMLNGSASPADVIAVCAANSTWNGTACAVPGGTADPVVKSSEITALPSSCTIAIGQSTCNINATWGSSGYQNINVTAWTRGGTPNIVEIRTISNRSSGDMIGVPASANPALDVVFEFNGIPLSPANAPREYKSVAAKASCVSGSAWSAANSKCEVGASVNPAITPFQRNLILAENCIVAVGASTCVSNPNWSTAGYTEPYFFYCVVSPTLCDTPTNRSINGVSGTVALTLSGNPNLSTALEVNGKLTPTGAFVVLSRKDIKGVCAANSTWNVASARCEGVINTTTNTNINPVTTNVANPAPVTNVTNVYNTYPNGSVSSLQNPQNNNTSNPIYNPNINSNLGSVNNSNTGLSDYNIFGDTTGNSIPEDVDLVISSIVNQYGLSQAQRRAVEQIARSYQYILLTNPNTTSLAYSVNVRDAASTKCAEQRLSPSSLEFIQQRIETVSLNNTQKRNIYDRYVHLLDENTPGAYLNTTAVCEDVFANSGNNNQNGQVTIPVTNSNMSGARPISCLVLNQFMEYGSSGSQVTRLQTFLVLSNDMFVWPNGYFGPNTLASVKNFQKRNGIDSSLGWVGPSTRSKIAELTCSGDRNAIAQARNGYTVSKSSNQKASINKNISTKPKQTNKVITETVEKVIEIPVTSIDNTSSVQIQETSYNSSENISSPLSKNSGTFDTAASPVKALYFTVRSNTDRDQLYICMEKKNQNTCADQQSYIQVRPRYDTLSYDSIANSDRWIFNLYYNPNLWGNEGGKIYFKNSPASVPAIYTVSVR